MTLAKGKVTDLDPFEISIVENSCTISTPLARETGNTGTFGAGEDD